MKRILLGIFTLSICGCGTMTCMDVAKLDPQADMIFGGVRTDVNCVITGDERWEELSANHHTAAGYIPANKYVLKTVCALDVPLSLAADTLMLPYAIWWTLQRKNQPQYEEAPVDILHEGTKISGKPTLQGPGNDFATRKIDDEK